MDLLETEIFDIKKSPITISKQKISEQKRLWKQFATWAYFPIGPNIKKRFRNHCRCLWSKIKHAYQDIEIKNKSLEHYIIPATIQRSLKDKLLIAENLTEIVASDINLKGYHHVFKPLCFKNVFNETMIDFFNLDPIITKNANEVVNYYYNHMLHNPSHQSKNFSKEFVEHYCSFTGNNNLPYTTSNTAALHCKEHQICVHNLIEGLQPLSNIINIYIRDTYPSLYEKLKKIDLGSNVPKSFGIFPSVAINYNVISQFHRDLKDHPNTLCVVCPLGTFEGGQLVFPELNKIIHAKEGQGIAFRSHILVHGNLPVITGIRHSIVFFVHATVIKQNRKFGSLFNNTDMEIDNNKKMKKQKFESLTHSISKNSKINNQKSLQKIKNSRRSHIGKLY